MEKMNKAKHLVVTELDCARDTMFNFSVESRDLLQDIKFLMSEYYVATFMTEDDGLKLAFNNGQIFKLFVAEIFN